MDNFTIDVNIERLYKYFESKLGKRVLKQLICIILLIFEIDTETIIRKMGCSPITLNKYTNLINNNRLEDIFKDNVYRRKSELEEYKEMILDELETHPPKTLREAAVQIEKLTGLKRSTNQISTFLKKTATQDAK